jgi:hypothetical protein
VALSLASAAFCAISRSMLAGKIAIDVRSHVASGGCSETRRGDSAGVTDALRLGLRRDLRIASPEMLPMSVCCLT